MKETLTMVSLPLQPYRNLYDPLEGLARGSLFADLEKPLEAVPGPVRKPKGKKPELEFTAVNFALDEIRLYLDTHPEDREALAYYRELLEKRAELAPKLAETAGMLTWHCPAGEWNWVETPFPWM